uniref:JmjC domain-containing protein n=1 Tax=Mucochytrium quahogii TaxID=96639 RepID=A0A7S2RQY1_9STRA
MDCDAMDLERFRKVYEQTDTPVRIMGCTREWDLQMWTLNFLLEEFGNENFALHSGQQFTLAEYVSYAKERGGDDEKPLYLFEDLSLLKCGDPKRRLLEGYKVPKYFQSDLFDIVCDDNTCRPRFRWMLIGPARSGTRIHVDPLGTGAWNTLLVGHKRWVLFPPELDTEAIMSIMSLEYETISVETWFLRILPGLKKDSKLGCKLIEFTQQPGETVFIPAGWWHIVLNLDMTVAVTQNFASKHRIAQVAASMKKQSESAYKLAWFREMRTRFPDTFLSMYNLPDEFIDTSHLEFVLPVQKWGLWSKDDREWLTCLQDRYSRFVKQLNADRGLPQTPRRIPKIIHHIWLGQGKIPNARKWMKSWGKFHTAENGWKVRLWRDKDVENLGLKNFEAYRNAETFGEKSDIARYEILERFGGIYVDIDFQALQSLDTVVSCLENCSVEFACGFSNVGAVELNNALIISTPGHRVLADLVAEVGETSLQNGRIQNVFALVQDYIGVDEKIPSFSSTSMRVIETTGPGLFTKVVMNDILQNNDNTTLVFGPVLFYPVANTCPHSSHFPEEAYAVHHWNRSWQT